MPESIELQESNLPETDEWEVEHAGSNHYIWSRDLGEDELSFDPSEVSWKDEFYVEQVELLWLNDEWNVSLARPNPQRGFLDVVTPQCLTTEDVHEALDHTTYLLDKPLDE